MNIIKVKLKTLQKLIVNLKKKSENCIQRRKETKNQPKTAF